MFRQVIIEPRLPTASDNSAFNRYFVHTTRQGLSTFRSRCDKTGKDSVRGSLPHIENCLKITGLRQHSLQENRSATRTASKRWGKQQNVPLVWKSCEDFATSVMSFKLNSGRNNPKTKATSENVEEQPNSFSVRRDCEDFAVPERKARFPQASAAEEFCWRPHSSVSGNVPQRKEKKRITKQNRCVCGHLSSSSSSDECINEDFVIRVVMDFNRGSSGSDSSLENETFQWKRKGSFDYEGFEWKKL